MPYTPPNEFTEKTKAKASEVNENFDAVATYTAAIPVADLADGTAGQIIVCNASGVPTYQTPSGPLAVSSAGATSLARSNADQGANVNLTASYQDLASTTPAAGTYLVIAKLVATSPDGTAFNLAGRLVYNVTELDNSYAQAAIGVGSVQASLPLVAEVTVDGSTAVKVQGLAVYTTQPVASLAKIRALRVA